MRHFNASLKALLGAVALLAVSLSLVSSKDLNLFHPISSEVSLTEAQNKILETIQKEKGTTHVTLVRPNLQLLDQQSVDLNLPQDKVMHAEKVGFEKKGNSLMWSGELPDEGSALFVVRDNNMTGTITSDAGTYKIRPLGEGIHAIVQIDQSKYPPEHPLTTK
jgi:hypothetical protein